MNTEYWEAQLKGFEEAFRSKKKSQVRQIICAVLGGRIVSWIDIVKGERYGDSIRNQIKYLDEKIKMYEQEIILMKKERDLFRELLR